MEVNAPVGAPNGAAPAAGNPNPAGGSHETPPPAAGTPPPAAAAAAAAAVADWTSSFDSDTKGYVQNKGFKDAKMVLDSYQNMEKLMGAPKERLLKLPENLEDKTAMGEVYKRLGMPDKPEDYKLEFAKELGDTKELAAWMQKTFFETGVSRKQASEIVAKWNEVQLANHAAQVEKFNNQANQEQEGLKKKWGQAFEQNVGIARRAAKEFGLDAETVEKLENVMGFTKVMELMNNIGSKLGEAAFHTGNNHVNAGYKLTPEAAQNRIKTLREDQAFVSRYLNKDVAAAEEMARLHSMAYPDAGQ